MIVGTNDAEVELAKHLKRAERCFKIAIALGIVSVICNIILLLYQGG